MFLFIQECHFSDKYKTILIGWDTKKTDFNSIEYRFEFFARVTHIIVFFFCAQTKSGPK